MSEEYYEKQLFETDSGEVYFVNEFGKLFLLDFQDQDDNENSLEKIEELIVDYAVISLETKDLHNELNKSAKKHGIEIGEKTRKDMVDEWRERKKKDELTEDLTSPEYISRKSKILQDKIKNKRLISEEEIQLDEDVINELDKLEDEEIVKTLEGSVEKSKKSMKLPERKNYNLEC